jgi:uncharacterized membrane protein
MLIDINRVFEKSPEGFQSLSWILYFAAGAVAASHWIDWTGTSVLVGAVVILVLSGLRKNEAASTIFGSHLQNIFSVMLAYLLVGTMLWLFTVLTLGIGVIITWPLSIILLLWAAYRLIKGLMRLNDGVAYT